MTKILSVLAVLAMLASAAFADAPVLLQTSRTGNRYFLDSYEQSENRITVVVRCVYSASERDKGIALLNRQGVPADIADRLAGDEFSLRYSEDGSRYQRLYERYIAADGQKGGINNMTGTSAENMIVPVPPGTIVRPPNAMRCGPASRRWRRPRCTMRLCGRTWPRAVAAGACLRIWNGLASASTLPRFRLAYARCTPIWRRGA